MQHLREMGNPRIRATMPLHPHKRQMHNTYRTQNDGLGDETSTAAATDANQGDSLTRQEFRDDADLNILLARFGVQTPIRTDGQYGQEIDYNIDLQQALGAVEAARRANLNVPDELRDKYPDWKSVLNAAETGEYQKDLQALADHKAAQLAIKKEQEAYNDERAAAQRRTKVTRDLKREAEDRLPEREHNT